MNDWTTTVGTHPANHPERTALWAQAVDVLTRAIRLTRTRGDGTVEPADFADFLATALAAAAANVGGPNRVTAGRPGSWEASHVEGLLAGTLGYDITTEALTAYRTEPVLVPLNVAQLVEDSGALPTLDEADQGIPYPGTGDGSFEHPHGEGATDEELDAREAAAAELRARYATTYARYAAAFATAVLDEARTIDGLLGPDVEGRGGPLRVPVEVVAETDPEAAWNAVVNPDEWGSDPLVWRLWSAARERTGTPQLDDDAGAA